MTKAWFLIFENEMMWGQNCCKILFFSQKKTRFPSLSFSVYTFLAGAEDQEQTISIELKKRWNISGLVGRVTEGSSGTNASKCVLNINSAEGRVNIQNQKRPNIVPQYLANIWIETNIARYLAKFWIGGCQHHNRRGLDLALQLVEAIHKNHLQTCTHKHKHKLFLQYPFWMVLVKCKPLRFKVFVLIKEKGLSFLDL